MKLLDWEVATILGCGHQSATISKSAIMPKSELRFEGCHQKQTRKSLGPHNDVIFNVIFNIIFKARPEERALNIEYKFYMGGNEQDILTRVQFSQDQPVRRNQMAPQSKVCTNQEVRSSWRLE